MTLTIKIVEFAPGQLAMTIKGSFRGSAFLVNAAHAVTDAAFSEGLNYARKNGNTPKGFKQFRCVPAVD